MGIPPTGRPVVMSGQEIYRAQGGRFVEVWHQEGVGAMLGQLELEPPPAISALRPAAAPAGTAARTAARNAEGSPGD